MAKKGEDKTKDTFGYKGWLLSDDFLKRTFAVMGYGFVGTILVNLMLIVVFVFFLLLSILFGLTVSNYFS